MKTDCVLQHKRVIVLPNESKIPTLSLYIPIFFSRRKRLRRKKNRTRLLSIGGIFARRNKNAQNGTLKTAFLKKGRSPFQFRYFAENIYYYIRYIFIYNSKPNNLKMNCSLFFVSVHGRTFSHCVMDMPRHHSTVVLPSLSTDYFSSFFPALEFNVYRTNDWEYIYTLLEHFLSKYFRKARWVFCSICALRWI